MLLKTLPKLAYLNSILGHNLVVTVLSCKVFYVVDPKRRISEYLVGDDNGYILLTARDEQGKLCLNYLFSFVIYIGGMTIKILHGRVKNFGGERLISILLLRLLFYKSLNCLTEQLILFGNIVIFCVSCESLEQLSL